MFPIAIIFFFYDVSQVRSISRRNSRLILQLICSKTEFKDKTMKVMQSFAQSINFRYGQLFIFMCKHLFDKEEVFNAKIANFLINLTYDNIANLRIILSQFLCDLTKKEKFAHLIKKETVRKIIKILKNDKLKENTGYSKNYKKCWRYRSWIKQRSQSKIQR